MKSIPETFVLKIFLATDFDIIFLCLLFCDRGTFFATTSVSKIAVPT